MASLFPVGAAQDALGTMQPYIDALRPHVADYYQSLGVPRSQAMIFAGVQEPPVVPVDALPMPQPNGVSTLARALMGAPAPQHAGQVPLASMLQLGAGGGGTQ